MIRATSVGLYDPPEGSQTSMSGGLLLGAGLEANFRSTARHHNATLMGFRELTTSVMVFQITQPVIDTGICLQPLSRF